MPQWEYCEVDFNNHTTYVYYYGEDGDYIDNPEKHPRLGVTLARLGNDGWEIISTWWRSKEEVTYMLKRQRAAEWTEIDRSNALIKYKQNHPKDRV